jgi:glycosyltransferase involved in cell wall biosynthesis
MKKIAFVVPSLNEEDSIGQLIDSIKRNTYKNKEIIVVDGGSRDRTVEIVKSKGARVINETGKYKCPANALNCGVRSTNADIICIVGSDFLVPDKNFASICAREFDEKTSAIYTKYKTVQDNFFEKIVSSKVGMSTCPTLVRRDVYIGAGHYPIIGVSEDVIFTLRVRRYAKQKGLKEKFVTATYYSGHAVKTPQELFKQAEWYGRTSLLFLKEYYHETKSLFAIIKRAISINLRLFYFLLFLFSLIFIRTDFFIYFFLPFLLFFFITILKNYKSWYNMLKVFTNLIFGSGFFIGLLTYLTGINKSRGRG